MSEGKAVIYTVEILEANSAEAVAELSDPDVRVAIVISPAQDLGAATGQVALVVDADMFAQRLASEGVALVLEDLVAQWTRGEGSERYEIDAEYNRMIDMTGTAGEEGERVLALGPSAIRAPGPIVVAPLLLRYRCNHSQHHVVLRPANSTGTPCNEPLPEGSPCPGTLDRF